MEFIDGSAESAYRDLRGKFRPVAYILPNKEALTDVVTWTSHETGIGIAHPVVVEMQPGTQAKILARQILQEGSRSTGACILTMYGDTWPTEEFAYSLCTGAGIMFRTVLVGITGGTKQDWPVINELAEAMWPAMKPEKRLSPFLPAALLVVLNGDKVEIEK